MSDSPHAEERDADAVAAWEAQDDASILQLNPETMDPAYKYRFCYNNPNRIARLKARGYEFVLAATDSVELRDPSVGEMSAEGAIRIGDAVLMRCLKDRYDARRRRIKSSTEARLGNLGSDVKEKIKEAAEQAGVHTQILTKQGGIE